MSIPYHYVNHTKRQHFVCGLFGYSSRFSGVGRGPGARMFAIACSDRGTWWQDAVSVSNDEDRLYDDGYRRVTIEAELALIDVDGLEFLRERVNRSPSVFHHLCDFALILRRSDVREFLDDVFGARKWEARYQADQKHTTNYWSESIAATIGSDVRLVRGRG